MLRPLILAIVVCAASAPARAGPLREATQIPIAGGLGIAERGREDYQRYCAPCHGVSGNGDGPLAAMLVPRPSRHNDAKLMSEVTDDELFRLLMEGGPALGKSPLMGAWGKVLSTQQIRDLLAYTRRLAVPDSR